MSLYAEKKVRETAKEYAKPFYNSVKWKRCRKSFIAYRQSVDGGLCQHCKAEPGKIVHHKVWINQENINDADIVLNHRNLEFVCQECHNKIREGEEERYSFTPDGQVVPR